MFTGPMGAGKTTAIRAISDAPPVSTEVANTDQATFAKPTTTVALDYGQLLLEDGTAVSLYGTPGQQRFSFMWEILCNGAIGIVLLIDGSTPTALDELRTYAQTFHRINPNNKVQLDRDKGEAVLSPLRQGLQTGDRFFQGGGEGNFRDVEGRAARLQRAEVEDVVYQAVKLVTGSMDLLQALDGLFGVSHELSV